MLYNSHLDIFIKVADCGSFNKASEQLYITPSAVIKHINILEEDLGVKLFHRSHRGLTLTDAGKSLYKDSKRIIEFSAEAERRIKEAMRKENNIIRIGSSPITPAEVLVELWPRIHAVNPDLKFQLVPYENTPENAEYHLKNMGKQMDIVAGIFDENLLRYRQCDGFKLCDEPICVAVPFTNPLSEKKILEITDLYGQKLMLMNNDSLKNIVGLHKYIKENHSRIEIIDFDFYNTSVFNYCEHNDYLLMAVSCWKNVHPLMKIIPVNWDFKIPYGLLHSPTPDKKVQSLLDILKNMVKN